MKHLLLATVLLSSTIMTASAQVPTPTTTPPTSAAVANSSIQQGNWVVGAGLGSTSFNFSSETFNIGIQPKAAYFFSDRVAVGAQVILGLSAYDGGSSFNYGIAPLIRYYVPEGASTTGRWFGEGTIGVAGSHYKNQQGDDPVSLLAGVGVGYAHFIARNVALEGILNYTYNKADVSAGSGTGQSGLGLSLGFQIYLTGVKNR